MEPTSPKNVEVNEQIIREIYENTRKTHTYIKWQLIITVALVVLPLLAMVVVVPLVLRSVSSFYGSALQ